MNLKLFYFILAAVMFYCRCYAQIKSNDRNAGKETGNKIIIEGEIPPDHYKKMLPNQFYCDSMEMHSRTIKYIGVYPEWTRTKASISNGMAKWILYSDHPLILSSSFCGYGILIDPGDSICVRYENGKRFFSGIGAEKFKLQDEISLTQNALPRPTKNYYTIKSLQDYFNWKKLLDKQLELIIPVIESYKNNLPVSSYDWIKTNAIFSIESARLGSFSALIDCYNKYGNKLGFNRTDLVAICDSTLHKPWLKWDASSSHIENFPMYFGGYNAIQINKRFGFDFMHDSINTREERRVLLYNGAKQRYSGLLREKVLQFIVADNTIHDLGPDNPVTQLLLKDYYNMPEFSEYKKWVKEYENSMRMRNGSKAPDFVINDQNGKKVSRNDLSDKIVLLDFWRSGCKECEEVVPALQQVRNVFKNDPLVSFVSISTDENKAQWLKSVMQRKNASGEVLNLFAGGLESTIIKDYNISSLPAFCLLDAEGKVVKNALPDPANDGGKSLIALLKKLSLERMINQHASLFDGPYVIYKDSDILINSILPENGARIAKIEKVKKEEGKGMSFEVATDNPLKKLIVQKKKELTIEPCEFPDPAKQLVLSDIEGNFEAFRNLLQSGGVIDSQFSWSFGNGHLIFNGDMFDRGNQVTECLWLVYSLEEKAKKAGGYVHFILGNHEIMNLSGDYRYVADKYKENARLLGVDYRELYNENSELGRWLRTKNIMEKIGNILYVHGGISPEVNRLPLNIQEMNSLARTSYSTGKDSANRQLQVLFSSHRKDGQTSPFWFRGYYEGMDNSKLIPTMQQVDSTMHKFEVSRIVTGHTIIADTITSHYLGKVINVDTKHSEGKSEALLIEGNRYYRITSEGRKELLLESEKRFTNITAHSR